MSTFFCSCDYYNFSQPQPTDKENIYEFPQEFRGRWVESEDSSLQAMEIMNSFKQHQGGPISWQKDQTGSLYDGNAYLKKRFSEEDSSCYFIDKKYAMLIMHEKGKVVAGAWPKISDDGEFSNAPYINTIQRIEYDSLQRPKDTLDKYFFHKDKIYKIQEDGFLGKGYSYYWDKDTAVVFENDNVCVDLGQNAFLRKLNENFYVLNIRNSILGEDNEWWRLMILEIKGENSFNIWECGSKTRELPSMFYDRPSKSDIFYFECSWSSSEILRLIKEKYFEITSTVTRDGMK